MLYAVLCTPSISFSSSWSRALRVSGVEGLSAGRPDTNHNTGDIEDLCLAARFVARGLKARPAASGCLDWQSCLVISNPDTLSKYPSSLPVVPHAGKLSALAIAAGARLTCAA